MLATLIGALYLPFAIETARATVSENTDHAIPAPLTDASNGQSGTSDDEASRRPVGFSSLSLGASFVDYEENSRVSVGGQFVDVETDLGAITTQRSNAFVAIDDRWGFYLFSVSTLGVPQSMEAWEVDEEVIRSNTVTFAQQRIGVLSTLRFDDRARWLSGLRYGKFEFSRFAPRLTAQAAQAGLTEERFPDGTVSETAWDITLLAGYERGILFEGAARGWQGQWRVLLGVPLIANVSNTEIDAGEVFRESLNGHSIEWAGILGFRWSTHFLIAASLQIELQERYAFDGTVSIDGAPTMFPGTRTVSVVPLLGAYWSF